MTTITDIRAREILDSRGNPTIEVEMFLDDGTMGRAAVPSGASTGTHEAWELRDNDPKRFGGKGELKAVGNVNGEIKAALVGKDASDQKTIDQALIALDGTENKERLGANAILAVSLATARAAAASAKMPLYEYLRKLSRAPKDICMPLPLCNVINGGKHAGGFRTRPETGPAGLAGNFRARGEISRGGILESPDEGISSSQPKMDARPADLASSASFGTSSLDIQEFMILPVGFATFKDAVRALSETFQALKGVLTAKGYATTVGDEGGFAPHVTEGNAEVLDLISEAVKNAGYELGKDIVFAIDAASSEFFADGKYNLTREGKSFSSDEMIAWYADLATKYPIRSIEDGLAENDWAGWQKMTAQMGTTVQIVGDDLFTTNVKFLARGIAEKSANAIIIKPNQIGTLTETIEAIDMAHAAGWKAIVSHRSGETEDVFISYLAVGVGCGQIKIGSVSRGERTAKYNELLRIEESLGNRAIFLGGGAFN